jgi:hypothetical protein
MRDVVRDLGDVADRPAPPERERDQRAHEPALERRGNGGKEEPQPPPVPLPSLRAGLRVLVLPAGDEADELAASMLQQLVRACGGACETVPLAALTDGLVDVVRQHPADVVVISAVPPSAVGQARHVHKRLRARFADLPIVVGLWTRTSQLGDVRRRLDAGDRTVLVATLIDALRELAQVGSPAPQPVGAGGPGADR